MSLDATQWAWRQNVGAKKLLSMAGEDHTCFPSLQKLMNDTELSKPLQPIRWRKTA